MKFPDWPSASLLKEDVLKYGWLLRGSVLPNTEPPAKFGTSTGAALAPINELSSFSESEIGKPDAKFVIPDKLHPSSARFGPACVYELIEGQNPVIAEHEVMRDVERAERDALARIERIHRILEDPMRYPCTCYRCNPQGSSATRSDTSRSPEMSYSLNVQWWK